MKCFRTLLAPSVVAVSALLAAEASAAADGPISFMVVDYNAPGMGEWWQKLVATHEANSGVAVEPRNTPAADYYEQLLIQAASGTAADVLTVNPNNLGELLAAEQLVPLDDMIEAAGLDERVKEGGFDALTVDGTIYAVPITGRTLELIYNRCHFEEAGIDAPPTTPEEFLETAKRLVVENDSGRVERYGANMVNANEDPTYEMLLMWTIAHGGAFSDADGNFTLDSEPVVKALRFMKEVYDSGAVPQGMAESDLRSLFATGGASMTIDGQWQFPFIEANNPDDFDCYASAKHPWDGPGTGGVNMALAVNADSENPQAAFDFIATALSPQMQSAFADYSPYIPFGVNALTDEQRAARPYLEPWIESIGTAHPIFIPGHEDEFNLIWPIVVDAILLTLRDGVPATESLAQAQAKLVECCAN